MRQFKIVGAAMAAALLVTACGGGGDGDQAPKVSFTSMVSFGDSLSDVGAYKVGDVNAAGGGKFTVNGITVDDNSTTASKNWTERIAAQLRLPAPCAAETGLAGTGFLTLTAGPIAPVFHGGCFNYAQGGSRVTLPVGPANIANTTDPVAVAIGELTVPVVTQIQRHLAIVGQFSGTELVTVWAGANDVLQLLDELTLAATAAGQTAGLAAAGPAFVASLTSQLAADALAATAAADISGAFVAAKTAGQTDAAAVQAAFVAAATDGSAKALAALTAAGGGDLSAINAVVGIATTAATKAGNTAGAAAGAAYATTHGPDLVVAMGTAGAQLANLVNTQIVAKGAKYVAVLNLPDVSLSPKSLAQPAQTQGLIHLMVTTFNAQLQAGLAHTTNVKIVDLYANVNDQVANMAAYGLTSVTKPACDMTKTALVSAMLCTKDTLMPGDVSHYLFMDEGGHPTPFELKLVASVVARDLLAAGWL